MYMHCTLNWIKSVSTNSNPTLPAFSDDFGITTKTSTHLADGHSKCAGSFSFVGGKLDLGLRISKGAWVYSRCPFFWSNVDAATTTSWIYTNSWLDSILFRHEISQIIIGNEGLYIYIIDVWQGQLHLSARQCQCRHFHHRRCLQLYLQVELRLRLLTLGLGFQIYLWTNFSRTIGARKRVVFFNIYFWGVEGFDALQPASKLSCGDGPWRVLNGDCKMLVMRFGVAFIARNARQ